MQNKTIESATNCFIARQALALRGNWKKDVQAEESSNFHQLVLLRSQDDPQLLEWLQRKSFRYTSPRIQNEMLEVKQ